MIVSIDWLKDFVDIKESPEELAEILSSVGLEAEYINSFSEISNVVIGKVISVESHPNAYAFLGMPRRIRLSPTYSPPHSFRHRNKI